MGDFNGDGKPDLAEASPNIPDHDNEYFSRATAMEHSRPGSMLVSMTTSGLASLAAADFTGSGTSDLSTFGSVLLGNLTISTATNDIDLPAGYVVMQADYAGDANNAPSSSTNAPAIFVPQQLFSLSSNPVTVAPGASANGSFSVTSSGFTGTLNLSCSIPVLQGQANPPTCSVPPTVNFFSAGGTVNLTYTVTAQATTPTGQYSAIITATLLLAACPRPRLPPESRWPHRTMS